MPLALVRVAVEGRAAAPWLLDLGRGQTHPVPSPLTITSGLRPRGNHAGSWLPGPRYCSCTKAEPQLAPLFDCFSPEPLSISIVLALGLPTCMLAKSDHVVVCCEEKHRSDTTSQWYHPNQGPQVVTPLPCAKRYKEQIQVHLTETLLLNA